MKQILWCSIIISLFFAPACSKKQVKAVLVDISRDTYEKNVKKQRYENLGNPNYQAPPTYDLYQKEKKLLMNDYERTPPEIDSEE